MTHHNIVGKDDDLESVLVAKLRKIEADLVRERREKTEGFIARDDLNQQLLHVQNELDTAQELIDSLEIDLQVAVATPTSFSNPTTPVRGKIVPPTRTPSNGYWTPIRHSGVVYSLRTWAKKLERPPTLPYPPARRPKTITVWRP